MLNTLNKLRKRINQEKFDKNEVPLTVRHRTTGEVMEFEDLELQEHSSGGYLAVLWVDAVGTWQEDETTVEDDAIV